MAGSISRRKFLAASAATAAASLVSGFRYPLPAGEPLPDIAVVTGENSYDATLKAIELLGGIKNFVSKGARVGILVNSPFTKPGTFTKPQVALAVVVLCTQAGAKEIISLEGAKASYWNRATLSAEHQELVGQIKQSAGSVKIPIKNGRRLKDVEVAKELLECDVYINIPIFKDHEGTHFTGCLKNIMGVTRGTTNQFFHLGSGGAGYYADPVHLSECIAEANQIRVPTLIVGDGTEMITTNGPFGPGKISRPKTIVAGTDPVAVDSYGATLLGLKGSDITMIRRASELKLGTMDLASLRIAKATL